jgi:hypothetical protein
LPRPIVKPRRSIFSVVLNAFMLGSVLILTFMVLIQEERYAMGQPGYFAGTLEQLTQQTDADVTGGIQPLPPD